MNTPHRFNLRFNTHAAHAAIHLKSRRAILTHSGLAAAGVALALLPRVSIGNILSQYDFGPTGSTPSILTPAIVDSHLTASSITADAGAFLDLTNPATLPASAPYLRVTTAAAYTTAAASFAGNADFQFTLSANVGYTFSLASLTFDVERGGAGTPRGYDVRSSADNFAATLGTADAPTFRPTFTPVTISLGTLSFQNITTITFKIFSYSPATGSSVEYDNITLNGVANPLAFNGYTWKGNVNGAWDTTTPNWTGPGSTYIDNTPTSDVLFEDTAINSAIAVSPSGLHPNTVSFNNSTAKNYTFSGGALSIGNTIAKSGTGMVTFNNAVSASAIAVNGGAVAIGATGSLTAQTLTVESAGMLTVASSGILGTGTGLVANGPVVLNSSNQSLASLGGASSGALTLNGTALEVTGASTYSGVLSGTGSLLKSGAGSFSLSGPAANTYSGTTSVTGGALNLAKSAGVNAVPGNITVTGGAALTFGAANQIPDSADVLIGDLITGGYIRTNTNADTFHNLSIVVPAGSVYNVNGTATSTLSNLTLTGTLSITNGEHDLVNSNTSLTANAIVLDGTIGRLGANSNPSIINAGSGGLNMTNSTFTFGTAGAAFPAQVNLNGNFTGHGINNFNVTNTLGVRALDFMAGTRNFDITDGITTIAAVIQNGSLNKIGAGALSLTGANIYSGATTLSNGILLVNGSISGSQTTVAGGTLGGIGITGPITLNTGTLAPGDGLGALNTADLALKGGTLAVEIGGNFIGSYDQLIVTGAISLASPVLLTLDFSTYDPVNNADSFVIASNDLTDAITFNAANARLFYGAKQLNEGTLFTAISGAFTQDFRITYAGGTDGNDIVLTAVPEPGTILSLLGGCAGILGMQRLRRRCRH